MPDGENTKVNNKFKEYLHSSKDSNWEIMHDRGWDKLMSEEAQNKYVYAFYEVRLDSEIDFKTGQVWITGIEGVPLERPVKA